MYLNQGLQKRIEKKKEALNKLRPLPVIAVKKLRERFELEMTYNSNAIEGNSLTLKETFLVISEGITIKGKPLQDHLEAKNHTEALSFVFDLIDKDKRNILSEHLVRTLHQLVVLDTEKEWAGKYRTSNVLITGTEHKPPEAIQVPLLMRHLIDWLRKEKLKLHPVELSALLHHRMVHIHPFFDGNGRTARLAMNVFLLQKGYPLVIILKNDRKKYYRVLARADKGEYEPLVTFIAQAVERSLDIYLKVLTPMHKTREEFYSLLDVSKGTPYSAKYLNLLARTGRLEAHKEGRNWLSTKEALKRYIDSRERKK
jgi:Fic family protein